MLMRLVRRLRDQGVAILYISHRLNEILDFCDHVTVLKDGAVTADRPLAGLDPDGLVRLMVGRDPQNLFPPYASHAHRRSRPRDRGFRAARGGGRRFRAPSRRDSRHRRARRARAGRLHDGPLRRHPRRGRAVPRVRERSRRAERALREGRRGQRGRRRLRSRRSAQGGPASAALDRLQSAAAVVRQPQRRASPGGAGDRDHRTSGAAPEHPGRPAPAGAGAVRRQPAEGRVVEMAAARAVGAAAERSDARRRRRDQTRDLSCASSDGGGGQSRGPAQHRHARTGASLRSRHGVSQRPSRRHAAARRGDRGGDRRRRHGRAKAPALAGEAA